MLAENPTVIIASDDENAQAPIEAKPPKRLCGVEIKSPDLDASVVF